MHAITFLQGFPQLYSLFLSFCILSFELSRPQETVQLSSEAFIVVSM